MSSEREGGMTDDLPRVTTVEHRDRLHAARRHGGACAACGRLLGQREAVYWERFVVTIERSTEHGDSRYWTTLEAPVGRECASPAFLVDTSGRELGRCAECGRGVYYRVARRRCHRVACCWLRRDRAGVAERAAKAASGR